MPRRKKRVAKNATIGVATVAKTAFENGGSPCAARRQIPAEVLIALALALGTFLIYLRASGNDFVYFDDEMYITENPHVQAGLTLRSVHWAATTFFAANWHPLTWMSHQLDCELFGMSPAASHLVSAAFHSCNAALLFAFLVSATKQRWPSAVCAALFVWHPLRVESVAWAAERKDVLSAFFFLLTLLAYLGYARRGGYWRYGLVMMWVALGLAAKPMLVTTPGLLLLLDYWPLKRFQHADARGKRRLLFEKIPLLVLSAASSIVTFIAQRRGGAVLSSMQGRFSLGNRIGNAAISCVLYVDKTFRPTNLAVFYPFPPHRSPWAIAGAVVLLAAITLLAVLQRRRGPYILVGWFWFLIALMPVIGLIQVGGQAMADRYTYLPSIGLVMAICWVGADIFRRYPASRGFLIFAAVASPLVLAGVTFRQIGYWRDGVALFTHTTAVTHNNWVAESGLGIALGREGRLDEAEAHFRQALRIKPGYDYLQKKLDTVGTVRSRLAAPEAQFAQAVRNDPSNKILQYDWANLLLRGGQFTEAINHYRIYLNSSPDDPQAHNNLGIAFARSGDFLDARSEFERAVAIAPNYADAECGLAMILANLEMFEEAIPHFQKALELQPDMERARRGLAECQERLG